MPYPIFRGFMDFFVALYDFGPFNENLVFCTVQKTENFSYFTKNVRKIIKQEGEAKHSAFFYNEIQKKRVNPLFLLRFFHDLSNPSQNAGDPKPSPCTAGRSFVKMKEGGGFPQSKLLRYREMTTSHDASFSNFFCSVMVTDFQKYEMDFRAWDMRVQTADKKVRSLELKTHPVKTDGMRYGNLKNMFHLAEAVFLFAENMFPPAETVFLLAENMFPLPETALPLPGQQGAATLVRPRTRTQNQKFVRVISVLQRFFVPGPPEVKTQIRLGVGGTKKTKNRSAAKGSHNSANSRKIHEKNEKSNHRKRKAE